MQSFKSQLIPSTLKSIGLLFVCLFIFSCSSKENKSDFSTEGMQSLDLSKYGKPFSIYVPDTVSSKLMVEEKSNGALEIKVGTRFAICINEFKADIELKKQDIKDDEVNKFKLYLIEQNDAIVWKSQITKPEFHFVLNQSIANADYSFEDINNDESRIHNEEQIQKMYNSCKNIEVKKSASKD